jgi:hypothetical protein
MKGKAKPAEVHVSLDNADTVIDGGPPFVILERWGRKYLSMGFRDPITPQA